ncbi:DUF6191 domain-containing protein [Streptomyces sp. NPDC053513]|uniref:DUF6191 domain-containing protein n=1 Tax=unclassified Streptomyces TaxID=2593676 RepID=UPI0037CD9C0C
MAVFGGPDEFFAPSRGHIEEERRGEALTREDPGAPGNMDPARGPVDLASGRVTIRLPRPPEVSGGRGDTGSEGRVEEVQAVGQGGGLAAPGDAELGEDVGDVDAGRLR